MDDMWMSSDIVWLVIMAYDEMWMVIMTIWQMVNGDNINW